MQVLNCLDDNTSSSRAKHFRHTGGGASASSSSSSRPGMRPPTGFFFVLGTGHSLRAGKIRCHSNDTSPPLATRFRNKKTRFFAFSWQFKCLTAAPRQDGIIAAVRKLWTSCSELLGIPKSGVPVTPKHTGSSHAVKQICTASHVGNLPSNPWVDAPLHSKPVSQQQQRYFLHSEYLFPIDVRGFKRSCGSTNPALTLLLPPSYNRAP